MVWWFGVIEEIGVFVDGVELGGSGLFVWCCVVGVCFDGLVVLWDWNVVDGMFVFVG